MPVFLEVVHSITPLTPHVFSSYVKGYQEVVVPSFERHGWQLLGAWSWQTGPMGRDLMLVQFDSLADLEQANRSLAKDTAMNTEFGKILGAAGAQVAETALTAYPVPYAQADRLQPTGSSDSPRQYMLARLECVLGSQPRAYELLGKLVTMMELGNLNLVTAYEYALGPRGVLTDLWTIEGGMLATGGPAPDAVNDLIAEIREVAPLETLDYLRPLPYSPLQ